MVLLHLIDSSPPVDCTHGANPHVFWTVRPKKKPTAGKHMATAAASTPKEPAAVVQLRMSVLQQMVQNNAGI